MVNHDNRDTTSNQPNLTGVQNHWWDRFSVISCHAHWLR